jgi:hypothetical protein
MDRSLVRGAKKRIRKTQTIFRACKAGVQLWTVKSEVVRRRIIGNLYVPIVVSVQDNKILNIADSTYIPDQAILEHH